MNSQRHSYSNGENDDKGLDGTWHPMFRHVQIWVWVRYKHQALGLSIKNGRFIIKHQVLSIKHEVEP